MFIIEAALAVDFKANSGTLIATRILWSIQIYFFSLFPSSRVKLKKLFHYNFKITPLVVIFVPSMK